MCQVSDMLSDEGRHRCQFLPVSNPVTSCTCATSATFYKYPICNTDFWEVYQGYPVFIQICLKWNNLDKVHNYLCSSHKFKIA